MFHATIKLEIRGWIKHEKKHFEKKNNKPVIIAMGRHIKDLGKNDLGQKQ